MITLSNMFRIEWIYIRIIKVVVYNVNSLKIVYKASNIIEKFEISIRSQNKDTYKSIFKLTLQSQISWNYRRVIVFCN